MASAETEAMAVIAPQTASPARLRARKLGDHGSGVCA
jgi:hypothetical protein